MPDVRTSTLAERLDRDKFQRRSGIVVGGLGFLVLSFFVSVTPTRAAIVVAIYWLAPVVIENLVALYSMWRRKL